MLHLPALVKENISFSSDVVNGKAMGFTKQAEPYVNTNDLNMSKLFSFPFPHLGNIAALLEHSSRLRSSLCVAVKKTDSMRITNGAAALLQLPDPIS